MSPWLCAEGCSPRVSVFSGPLPLAVWSSQPHFTDGPSGAPGVGITSSHRLARKRQSQGRTPAVGDPRLPHRPGTGIFSSIAMLPRFDSFFHSASSMTYTSTVSLALGYVFGVMIRMRHSPAIQKFLDSVGG